MRNNLIVVAACALILGFAAVLIAAGWQDAYSLLTAIARGDLVLVQDVSDTTDSANGTTKYTTTGYLTAPLEIIDTDGLTATVAQVQNTIINNDGWADSSDWEMDAPAVALGFSFMIYCGTAGASNDVILDPNGSEYIELNGDLLSAGEAVVNTTPEAGDKLKCVSGTRNSTVILICSSVDGVWDEETP